MKRARCEPPNREAFRIDLAKTHEMEADAASSTMCRVPFFSAVSPPLQQQAILPHCMWGSLAAVCS